MYPIRSFTDDEILKIKNYKFSTKNSPISYSLFLQSWFDKLQTYIPKSIMPNQITWFGYLSMILSLIITITFDYSLASTPRFLPLANLILLFVYFCADFLDGVHARATKQCSSLGALLDHGVDSIVVLVVLLSACSSVGIGITNELGFIAFIFFSGFYFVALFIKYVGYMKLSIISGQSEGLMLIMLIHLLSFLRPSFINTLKTTLLDKPNKTLKNTVMNIIGLASTIISIFDIFYFISRDALSERSGEILASISALHLLLSFLYFLKLSNIKLNPDRFYLFISIFSQCFTVCYIEETISFLCGSATNPKAFLSSYMLLSLFISCYLYSKNTAYTNSVFFLSSLHFLLRIGSILFDLSKKLDCKLFTRSF